MSTTTIVAPTGVPATIDIKIPAADVHAASTPEHIVTLKKLLNILMAEIAGNTTRADISSGSCSCGFCEILVKCNSNNLIVKEYKHTYYDCCQYTTPDGI